MRINRRSGENEARAAEREAEAFEYAAFCYIVLPSFRGALAGFIEGA